MRIRKISQLAGFVGAVTDGYSTSNTDAYSCNYVNGLTTDVWENIDTTGWTKTPSTLAIGYAKYNKITKEVWITAYSSAGVNNTTTVISGIQTKYRPSSNIQQNANGLGCWVASPNTSSPFARIDATIKSTGDIQLYFPVGATMYQLGFQVRYIAV